MMPITQQISAKHLQGRTSLDIIHLPSPLHTFTHCLTGIQKLPFKNLPDAKCLWVNFWFQNSCSDIQWPGYPHIAHTYTHSCANSNIWRLGENSENTFHHSMLPFRKFSEHHQTPSLHSCLPASQIKKQALTSATTALVLPIISSASKELLAQSQDQ